VISRTDDLPLFASEWTDALAQEPAISHFKMKDAHGLRGEFRGMSSQRRDEKLLSLAHVIQKYAIATVAVTTRHDDYRKVFHGKMMRSMDAPYQMMFHFTLATVHKLLKEIGKYDRVNFVFDRQLDHEVSLKESFSAMKGKMNADLAGLLAADPRHADDKDEVPLQAADMIAWHVRRSWKDGAGAFRSASAAGPILAAIPSKHDFCSAEFLQFIAGVAQKTVSDLDTVFPYEAERMSERFDGEATYVNLQLIADAKPFSPVELIAFPAIGISKYLLVCSCESVGKPHLHKRHENRCLGEVTGA